MTLENVADWVTSHKMKRADLQGDVIVMAKEAMYSICSKVPFDELQTLSAELPMVSGQDYVDISTVTSPPIAGLLSVRATYTSTRVRRLIRSNKRVWEQRVNTSGEPAQYARVAKKLYFDKTPNSSAWTIRLYYWSMPALATDEKDTTLPWPPEWDELEKWETLYRTYMFIEAYDKAAMLMGTPTMPQQYGQTKRTPQHEFGIIPRLWNDLLKTTSMREASDEEFTVNPIVRSYTSR